MTFLEMLKEQVIILDGATGTMIQALELDDAAFGGSDYKMLSDLLCFSRPEAMKGIHRAFYEAGANAVETNTFGASPMRLSEYNFHRLDTSAFDPIPDKLALQDLSHDELAYHLSRQGARIAGEARDEYMQSEAYDGRPLFVIGSIGPSNRVVSYTKADLTVSSFDAISANFKIQVEGLIDGGADVLLFETQQDILELKAAIMGGQAAMAEKGVKLPIMAQVTVDQYSRMQIFNTDIQAALVTIQGIGVDVFGINCSIGPDMMEKTVEKLTRFARIPISVIPNAGLPISEHGKTVFKFPPEEFGQFQKRFVEEYGVKVVGGCCGTTPDHIRCVAEAVKGLQPKPRTPEPGLYVSGPQEAVLLDGSKTLIRIGERLNVRGSKAVRMAVENETGIDQEVLEGVVQEQVEGLGCEVIDVCMDSNMVNTVETLKQVIHVQTGDFSGAMSLDSFQVDALAEAVKCYPGRPIINSISMEEASPGLLKVDAVLQATQAHDAVYVGLCTGPKGPAATAEEKLDIASQIVEASAHYGVTPDRLFIDVNVFPIGSESREGMNFALETLEGIRLVKEKYPTIYTTLGVGNLTNGLAKKPYMRKVLTSVFLNEARTRGLDSAIINPNHYVFVEDLDQKDYELGLRAVMERDMDAYAELEDIAEAKKGIVVQRRTSYDDLSAEEAVVEKIKDGFKERENGSFTFQDHEYDYIDKIVLQVADCITRHQPLDFINEYLMGAMKDLGDGFGRGEVSLPHLLKSADVMRQAMGFLEAYMHHVSGVDVHDEIQYKGTIVIGTVYQDVHSIGKDLARTLLENYGYRVIDLGTMTPLQDYIDQAKEHKADAIGMSALLVQTSNHMITVSSMMQEQGLDTPILIGGAPVSDRHAAFVAMAGHEDPDAIRSDVFYCRTAMDGVNVMNRILSDKEAYFASNKERLLQRLERAKDKSARDAELLARLPRRVVDAAGYQQADAPRFARERVEFRLDDFALQLDRKTLFSLNWRFGGASSRKKSGHSQEELEALLKQWVARCTETGWIKPQGVMGLYPCQADGDDIVIFDPEQPDTEIARMDFTVVIGSGREDIISGAQYFPPIDSGVKGVVGLQLTTSGAQVEVELEELRRTGDTEGHLLLQGLSDRVAEDMADNLNAELCRRLGLPEGTGTRWSPGYPGMTNLANNETLWKLLNAGEACGVQLTDAGEFRPTGTTAAVVSFHEDARYT